MTEYSQNWANTRKGITRLSQGDHSKLDMSVTNAEGMGLSGSPEATVKMFYNEIKDYDYNNPQRNGRTGKFSFNRNGNLFWHRIKL